MNFTCLCTVGDSKDFYWATGPGGLAQPSIQYESRLILYAKAVLYLFSYEARQNTSLWWKIDKKKDSPYQLLFFYYEKRFLWNTQALGPQRELRHEVDSWAIQDRKSMAQTWVSDAAFSTRITILVNYFWQTLFPQPYNISATVTLYLSSFTSPRSVILNNLRTFCWIFLTKIIGQARSWLCLSKKTSVLCQDINTFNKFGGLPAMTMKLLSSENWKNLVSKGIFLLEYHMMDEA
jgi:hypothetical protein